MSKHKTPLRYPGGKQKLTPFIEEVIKENGLESGHYVEPYAGGAGVAIELLLSGVVSKVHINDFDPAVYAFWRSIQRFPEEFCRRIQSVPLTVDEWKKQRSIFNSKRRVSQFDRGFAFFYLNRCNRSGIINAGVIGGYSQNGDWKIDARFPRGELIKRIEAIAAKKTSLVVKNEDAAQFIKTYIPKLPRNTLVYLDPPYFEKAARLYSNSYKVLDHERVAKLVAARLKRPWLVSYDNAPQICDLYSEFRTLTYDLQYNAAKAYKGRELFVFSDRLEIPEVSRVGSLNPGLRMLA